MGARQRGLQGACDAGARLRKDRRRASVLQGLDPPDSEAGDARVGLGRLGGVATQLRREPHGPPDADRHEPPLLEWLAPVRSQGGPERRGVLCAQDYPRIMVIPQTHVRYVIGVNFWQNLLPQFFWLEHI